MAKASAEASMVKPEGTGSFASKWPIGPTTAPPSALANYIPSEEQRSVEAALNEHRRLCEEHYLLKVLILSAGLKLPPGVGGRGS